MEIIVPLFDEMALKIAGGPDNAAGDFPTSGLQKGLILLRKGATLAEEAVGFGVPVLKRGLQTIFPGGVGMTSERTGDVWDITALFLLNMEEKFSAPENRRVGGRLFYTAKNSLAALIRQLPALRGVLTATSGALRKTFGWETTYVQSTFSTIVKMHYAIDGQSGRIAVDVDPGDGAAEGVTEIVVMNELGATNFERYRDSSGTVLRGKEIGCWDEVRAKEAGFESEKHRVAFTLGQAKGVKLFRGREQIGSRLAWSGFGYSLRPAGRFSYTMKIQRIP
jgi:hypothetical protein